MKNISLKPAIFMMVILFFSGCTFNPKPSQETANQLSDPLTPESSYYYFTEAQFQKNKGNPDKAIFYLGKAIESDPESLYLKRELALFYLYGEKIEEALNVVEKILEKNPNEVEALIMAGRIKQALNLDDDVKEIYEKVITNDPKQEAIYLILGGLYLDEGDLEKAFSVFEQLVENFPESYAGEFFLGKIYAEQGKFKEAEKKLNKTLELEPNLLEPRFELLNIYKIRGNNTEKIIRMYKEILEINPNDIKTAMDFGLYYHKNGMTKEAGNIFKELGLKSISDPDVIRKVLKHFVAQKRYTDAITVLEGMLKGAPESSDIHYIAGIAYDGNKNKKMAIMHFKQVMPGSDFYNNAAVHVAFLYQAQGKINEAINFLKDVIDKTADNAEFMLYIGSFYEEIKQYEDAEKILKKAIEIDGDNTRLHFRLGVIYDKWGKKTASIEQMKTVIRLDPEDANALNYLGYTYADLGENLDEAERLIKEALRLKPDDGYIIDSLGWVYFKQELFEKAVKFLEKAVSLIPDDPILLEHLGDARMKTGDKKKALDSYKRALIKKKQEEDKSQLENKIRILEDQGI